MVLDEEQNQYKGSLSFPTREEAQGERCKRKILKAIGP